MKSELKATHRHLDKKHKIKNVIKDVLYNSFAQALYKIFTTHHFILKVFLLTFVLASACLARGYQVLLVSGPTSLELKHPNLQVVNVQSHRPQDGILLYSDHHPP